MFTRQRSTWLLVILLSVALLLAACERPLNRGDDESEEQEPLPTVVITESETSPEDVQEESDEASEEAEEPEAEIEESEEESTETEPEAEPTEVVTEPDPTPETDVEESNEDVEGSEEETTEEEQVDEESAEDEDTGEADSDSAEEEAESDTEETEDSDQDEEDQSDTSETEVSTTLPLTHTVAAGENLYRISLLYGIPLAEMAAFNNILNVDQVFEGQVLQIPGGTVSEPSEPEEPAEPVDQPEEPAEPEEPPSEGTLYTVQLGDTLSQIGFLFGVSWVEIAEANGIVDPNQIYEGQILKIPTPAPGPNPQFAHTVVPGQTLHTISIQYGVAWLTIASANQLGSPYVIYPGQTLVIPGA